VRFCPQNNTTRRWKEYSWVFLNLYGETVGRSEASEQPSAIVHPQNPASNAIGQEKGIQATWWLNTQYLSKQKEIGFAASTAWWVTDPRFSPGGDSWSHHGFDIAFEVALIRKGVSLLTRVIAEQDCVSLESRFIIVDSPILWRPCHSPPSYHPVKLPFIV
jgi:hypothetical protein